MNKSCILCNGKYYFDSTDFNRKILEKCLLLENSIKKESSNFEQLRLFDE